MIKKLLNWKITNRVALIFVGVALFQNIIAIYPVTVFLVRGLNVPKTFLLCFEFLTVPITLIVLIFFVFQKTKFFNRLYFGIGFFTTILFVYLMFIEWYVFKSSILGDTIESVVAFIEPGLTFISVTGILEFLLFDLADGFLSLYKWRGWASITLYMSFFFIVTMPILFGIFTHLVISLGMYIRKKLKHVS